MRADIASGAQPRHVEPSVRAVDQRWRHGPLSHAQIQKEVRHHSTLQANLIYPMPFT